MSRAQTARYLLDELLLAAARRRGLGALRSASGVVVSVDGVTWTPATLATIDAIAESTDATATAPYLAGGAA